MSSSTMTSSDVNSAPSSSSPVKNCSSHSPSAVCTPVKKLHDTQATADKRGIAIDYVGVKNVQFPVQLKMRDGSVQHTVGTFALYVSLPADQRGTHMSRFMEALQDFRRPLDHQGIRDLCASVRERLFAPSARIQVEMPFFLEKAAPVSGVKSLLDYKASFHVDMNESGESISVMGVKVPAKSLCPCSKEISDYGAHNQRSIISADVKYDGAVWIEDLIETMEQSASSPLYALLKRPDERFVTQAAYDNPKFVEDIVRDLALGLDGDDRVTWYRISAENFESIHNHEAYAQIERTKV